MAFKIKYLTTELEVHTFDKIIPT